MNTADIVSKVEVVITPVLTELGFEVVELVMLRDEGRWVLRLRIDAPPGIHPPLPLGRGLGEGDAHHGVTIADCAKVARELGGVLDVEAQIPVAYSLEVSSPGLDRPLRTALDFARFAGSEVEIRTLEPIEERRNFRGRLDGVEDNIVRMTVDGQPFAIPMTIIEKAKKKFQLQKGQKRKH